MNPPDSNISCKIGENVKLGLQWIRTYSCFALPVWGEGSFTFLRSQRLNKVIHISKRIWVGVAFAPFGVSKEIMSGAGSLQSCPSLWPYGLEPTRLPCPWDSPGKNTGVGCYALLQGIFQIQHLFHLLHWQAVSLPLILMSRETVYSSDF